MQEKGLKSKLAVVGRIRVLVFMIAGLNHKGKGLANEAHKFLRRAEVVSIYVKGGWRQSP
jgi:hypothetical protein